MVRYRPTQIVALLGRYSLTVFVCSVLLDYLFKQAIHRCQIGFPGNLLFLAAELLLLYGVAWTLGQKAPEEPSATPAK